MYTRYMERYREEMLRDLRELVAIESVAVRDEASDRLPFGAKSAEAIAYMTRRGKEMGFSVENCDNFACHVQLGGNDPEDEENYVGVLAHVDVMPVGDGWHSDPLTLTERGGYLYGRGVADDKGAAIAALYCLRAIRESGVSLRRPVRCIFGGGEEIGMDDMAHYFSKHPLPRYAFTPDADYPACHCEKGILHLRLTGRTAAAFLGAEGGSAINCVADRVTARVKCDAPTANAVAALINQSDAQCEVAPAEGGYALTVRGVSAHAMCPEKGVNAVNSLLTAAEEADLLADGSAEAFFAEYLCADTTGRAIGIACEDAVSGALTLNVGRVFTRDGETNLDIDIRYPATLDSAPMVRTMRQAAQKAGVRLEILHDSKPLYVPADSELVTALGECYTEVTGQPMVPMAMGGGTYARALGGRGVAFGPVFPDAQPSNLHMPDENLSLEEFMKHAEICCRAMLKLATV